MNYLITDEVPEHWNDIIDAFVTMSEWEVEFNKGTPIDCIEFSVRRGLLAIAYEGGDTIIDAHARFARAMSAKICYSCGAPSSREVFQYPKCEDCD